MPGYLVHRNCALEAARRLKDKLPWPILRGQEDSFLAGAQGGDPFYFYRYRFFPLGLGVAGYGKALHHSRTEEFFSQALAYVRAHFTDRLGAYLFGYLAHYALDRTVHPIIHENAAGSLSRHNRLETDLDVWYGRPRGWDLTEPERELKRLAQNAGDLDRFHETLARSVYGMDLPPRAFSRSLEDAARAKNALRTRRDLPLWQRRVLGWVLPFDVFSLVYRPDAKPPAGETFLEERLEAAVALCGDFMQTACHCLLGRRQDAALLAAMGGLNFSGKRIRS